MDLLVWCVDRSCRVWGGVVLVVVAAASPIMVPELQPHLGVAGCSVEELCGSLFLGAVDGMVAATALGTFVLSLLPHLDSVCSIAAEELWRLVYRSLRWWFVVLVQVLGLLAGRIDPLHGGRSVCDFQGVDLVLDRKSVV